MFLAHGRCSINVCLLRRGAGQLLKYRKASFLVRIIRKKLKWKYLKGTLTHGNSSKVRYFFHLFPSEFCFWSLSQQLSYCILTYFFICLSPILEYVEYLFSIVAHVPLNLYILSIYAFLWNIHDSCSSHVLSK